MIPDYVLLFQEFAKTSPHVVYIYLTTMKIETDIEFNELIVA